MDTPDENPEDILEKIEQENQKMNGMTLKETLEHKLDQRVLRVDHQTPRNDDNVHVHLGFDNTPSEIGQSAANIDELADDILDWHSLRWTLKQHTGYRITNKRLKDVGDGYGKRLILTLKEE